MYRTFIIFLILVVPSTYADTVHAVFLIHEKEYETKRTVPEFAEAELVEKLGWKCTYLFGDGENDILGTKVLKKADVLFISLRRQALPTCWLYQVKPLAGSATPFMWGQYEENTPEPVAWTNTSIYGGSVFYTPLGHPDDFASPDFRRMLVNGLQ